jgi:hypothetical protein
VRKINPTAVKKDFAVGIKALEGFYGKGYSAFTSESDRSTLTEHSVLTAAVLWEGFVNDLLIAYINRDASNFKEHLKNSFEAAVGDGKPRLIFTKYGKLAFPAHLKKAAIEQLADQDGGNITFPDFTQLENKVETWLSPNDANKFKSLTPRQKAAISALIAVRNHIAHRSSRSLKAMNAKVAVGALYGSGLQRGANQIHNVGVWLKAKPQPAAMPRFATMLQILDGIGAAL